MPNRSVHRDGGGDLSLQRYMYPSLSSMGLTRTQDGKDPARDPNGSKLEDISLDTQFTDSEPYWHHTHHPYSHNLTSRLASISEPSLSLARPAFFASTSDPHATSEDCQGTTAVSEAPLVHLTVAPQKWVEPRPTYPSQGQSIAGAGVPLPERPRQPFKLPPQKGKRTYQCPHCDLAFTRPSAFKQHFLSHSGEQPHACPACGRRFSLLSNLRRHNRTCKKSQQETPNSQNMTSQSQEAGSSSSSLTISTSWATSLPPLDISGYSSLPNTPTFTISHSLPSIPFSSPQAGEPPALQPSSSSSSSGVPPSI